MPFLKPINELVNPIPTPERADVEELKARMKDSEFQGKIERRKGSEHPHWNDGSSGTHLGISRQQFLRWRKKIFERDSYSCQLCTKVSELCMHHINFVKTDFRDENLITLCGTCNREVSWQKEHYERRLLEKAAANIQKSSLPAGIEPGKKEQRKRILERDNYTCRLCGKTKGDGAVLQVFGLNMGEENSITLCALCHGNVYRHPELLDRFKGN